MTEIKAYQDGKDFVVIFKNCHPDQRKLIESLLKPEIIDDSNVVPTPEEDKEIIINFSKYNNVSANDILRNEGDAGYANLRWMLSKGVINEDDELALRELLSMYAYETFSRISDPYKWVADKTVDECKAFIKSFSDYLTDEIMASAAEQAGYTDFSSFIDGAGEEVIRSFTAAFIEKNKL